MRKNWLLSRLSSVMILTTANAFIAIALSTPSMADQAFPPAMCDGATWYKTVGCCESPELAGYCEDLFQGANGTNSSNNPFIDLFYTLKIKSIQLKTDDPAASCAEDLYIKVANLNDKVEGEKIKDRLSDYEIKGSTVIVHINRTDLTVYDAPESGPCAPFVPPLPHIEGSFYASY